MDSFYSKEELDRIKFKKIGVNVKISRRASLYGVENIEIGDNVRIDDFCILSGKIILGSYVHIAAYCALFGGEKGIIMDDFSGMSSRCVIYAESDDYSGEALTNPTVENKYRNILGEKVAIGRHVIIGTGTCILPGVQIGEGASVGSMSMVNCSLTSWGIYAGIPCRFLKERKKDLLKLEHQLRKEE